MLSYVTISKTSPSSDNVQSKGSVVEENTNHLKKHLSKCAKVLAQILPKVKIVFMVTVNITLVDFCVHDFNVAADNDNCSWNVVKSKDEV